MKLKEIDERSRSSSHSHTLMSNYSINTNTNLSQSNTFQLAYYCLSLLENCSMESNNYDEYNLQEM